MAYLVLTDNHQAVIVHSCYAVANFCHIGVQVTYFALALLIGVGGIH